MQQQYIPPVLLGHKGIIFLQQKYMHYKPGKINVIRNCKRIHGLDNQKIEK